MRSCLVEVGYIGIEDSVELLLMQDEQMIEALTPHTAEETLTDGIGSRGAIRGFEYLDATCLRNPSEALCWLLGTSVHGIGVLRMTEQGCLLQLVRGEYNKQGSFCSSTRPFSRRRGSIRAVCIHLHQTMCLFQLSCAA